MRGNAPGYWVLPQFEAKVISPAEIRMNQGDHRGIVQMDSPGSGVGFLTQNNGVESVIRQLARRR